MPAKRTNKMPLEVHEHWFVSGPRASSPYPEVRHICHSHPGGTIPHQHPNMGPASYTIDKDEWLAKTGLRGGGKKKFTAQPSGEQFAWVALTPEQNTFELHIVGPAMRTKQYGDGPGIALPLRMILGHGMRMRVVR
jgi:hypothetical protein